MRAVVAVVLAAALLGGCGTKQEGVARPDLTALSKAIAGVPQNANVLGDKSARFTFGVYAQPASEAVATKVMPQLDALLKQVTSGDLNVKFRATGPTAASKVMVAAGLQGRFWPALVAFESDRRRDANAVLSAGGVEDVEGAIAATADPRVAKSIARNERIAAAAGAEDGADVFVVTNRRGVLVDITAQVEDGRLLDAVAAAERKIGS